VDAHTFTKQAKEVQTNVCKKADGYERRTVGGIHATRNKNNIRSVLQNTKNSVGPFISKGMEC
jgi:hypothetical protein